MSPALRGRAWHNTRQLRAVGKRVDRLFLYKN
nr:MAG TPA_asm: hypothetical protein [Bacteriophage sp.]DAM79155.1 MAG TPA: hypothetical protein [Caudoviricetes sp.]